MTPITIALLAFPLAAAAGCVAVEGPFILAGHAARESPAFAALPASAEIALAPDPPARRVIAGDDAARILRRYGAPAGQPIPPLCFEYLLKPVSSGHALDALREAVARRATGSEQWEFELIDSPSLAPPGPLEFHPLATLPAARPDGLRTFQGRVRYAGERWYPFVVRARITKKATRWIATRPIRAGERVGAAARRETFDDAALEQRQSFDPDGVIAARDIAEGAVITAAMTRKPPDVAPGQVVRVAVIGAGAAVHLDARAQARGRAGDRVALLNERTGRRFTGTVAGPGAVVVRIEGGSK